MKIRLTLFHDTREFSEVFDESELTEDYELSPEQYRPLDPFLLTEIHQYKGNHFVYGEIEALSQSDLWIPGISDNSNVRVRVTHSEE